MNVFLPHRKHHLGDSNIYDPIRKDISKYKYFNSDGPNREIGLFPDPSTDISFGNINAAVFREESIPLESISRIFS